MHPQSTETSSECVCCVHTQQATGWEERSLWQQMWNCISESTSKTSDSRETDPQCFLASFFIVLVAWFSQGYQCQLGTAACSTWAPGSSNNTESPACFSSDAASLQQKRRCWTGCKPGPVPRSLLHSTGTPQTSALALCCTEGVGYVWKPKQSRDKAERNHLRQVPGSGEHRGGHEHWKLTSY